MKKVIVIGCPGSGKSTFSRRLRDITGLPLFYLDMIFHNPDKTTVSRNEFDIRLSEILKGEKWIIDGNYLRTMEKRISECETVFWLNYPREVCLDGIKARIGKSREDMPWIETENDEELVSFVKSFEKESKPVIQELLKAYSNKEIHIFSSREESEHYLGTLS